MSAVQFQTRFTEVIATGDSVVRRLSGNGISQGEIVDIIRALIEAQLVDGDSPSANLDLASALVRFQELHPGLTGEKFTLLKGISIQVVDLAGSLDEESKDNTEFYRGLIGRKGSPFYSLVKGVIECLHPSWTAEIKKARHTEIKEYLDDVLSCLALYLGASLILYKMTPGGFSLSDCILSLVPGIGQAMNIHPLSGWRFLVGIVCMLYAALGFYRTVQYTIELLHTTNRLPRRS